MEIDYKLRCEQLVGQVTDLREDLRIAKAEATGDPVTIGSAREGKITRQRNALRNLNRRVRVQRLQLRRLNELERGLRVEEWNALKEEFSGELDSDLFEEFR